MLMNQNSELLEKFDINPDTGVITTKVVFDRSVLDPDTGVITTKVVFDRSVLDPDTGVITTKVVFKVKLKYGFIENPGF